MRLLVQGSAGHGPIVAARVPSGADGLTAAGAASCARPRPPPTRRAPRPPRPGPSDRQQEPLAVQRQVRLEGGHLPEPVDQHHGQDEGDLVPEVDGHRSGVEDGHQPVQPPPAGEPRQAEAEPRLGVHQRRHEPGRPERLGERDVVEVVGPVLARCAHAYQAPYARAASDRATTGAAVRRARTPSRWAKPSIQQKRYVARSSSPVPKRSSGVCQTWLRTTTGARDSSSTGTGGAPEDPQQQRREQDEPQVRPQVPEDLPRLLAPRAARRITERHDPEDDLPAGHPAAHQHRAHHEQTPAPQRWEQAPQPAPDHREGRRLSSDVAISVPARPNMMPMEGKTSPAQGQPKAWYATTRTRARARRASK